METEQTFTRGPILSTLLKFALPGQRVAKRNARKEKQTKCVLAPR